MKTFDWGLVGILSACLGCLALVMGVFINFLPICQTSPTPTICNGFVTLPLVYLGLAGILLSLASLDNIHAMNNSSQFVIPRKRTVLSSIRRGLGVLCYLVGLAFVVWTFILFIPFDFEVSPNHYISVQFGVNSNPQNLLQIVVFEAAMFAIALLGTYLAPSIKRSISLYTAVAVIAGSAFASLSLLRVLLQFS